MTQRAYSQGSTLPPLEAGVIRLYSMRFCPFSQRARLVLAHKNIAHETININLKNKPEWFVKKSPLGPVPVLEVDDKVVCDSLLISDLLDDLYPQDRLQPGDPFRKADDKILVLHVGKLHSALFALIGKPGFDTMEQADDTLVKYLRLYEDALGKRGGPYFGGTKVTMVDLMLWPHFERFPATLKLSQNTVFTIDSERYPRLAAWRDAMYTQPAVRKTIHDVDIHLKHFDTVLKGEPDYDIGLA